MLIHLYWHHTRHTRHTHMIPQLCTRQILDKTGTDPSVPILLPYHHQPSPFYPYLTAPSSAPLLLSTSQPPSASPLYSPPASEDRVHLPVRLRRLPGELSCLQELVGGIEELLGLPWVVDAVRNRWELLGWKQLLRKRGTRVRLMVYLV
jgi:hypothetical protein